MTDEPEAVRAQLKPFVALYIGGMGAPGMNFHAEVFTRMGYGEEVADIGRLFQEGRKAEAAQVVPDELVAEISIVGTAEQVRRRDRPLGGRRRRPSSSSGAVTLPRSRRSPTLASK